MMWATWWFWVAAGFALGLLELLAPGYIFLGFAIGAVLMAILVPFGLANFGLPVLLIIFGLVSVVAWALLIKIMGKGRESAKVWTTDINDH